MIARSRLRALIFDVDGTLAETEELHRRAFNEAFAGAGLDWRWSPELYAELLKTAGGKERIAAYLRDHRGEARDAAWDAAGDAAWIVELHRDKTARYGALMRAGALDLRPGVRALIEDARAQGLKRAIATTTSRPNVEALCSACFGRPATDVFDVIAAGDEVAAKKPAPDVYALALDRLGLPAAACVAIEDSRNGVLSARAAGLRCLVVRAAYTRNDDMSGADGVFERFADIASVAAIEAALAGRA